MSTLRSSRAWVAAALIGISQGSAQGAADAIPPIALDIKSKQSRKITWQLPVTDAQLENPNGYFPAMAPAHRVIDRVVIRNAGNSSIKNPMLTINGRGFVTVNSVVGALGLESPVSLTSIFSKWKERRVHASSGLMENGRGIEVLRAFGVTLCGDDSKAMAEIVTGLGGTARLVRLVGHVACEYSLHGVTAVMDGDQNIFYTRLDHATPATEDDIRRDPLLALRMRVFGRQMPYHLPASWMNTSRFDHQDETIFPSVKVPTPDPDLHWELLPGESLEFFPTSDALPAVYAATAKSAENPILRESVIAVKFHVDLAARKRRGDASITLPFPAVALMPADGRTVPLMKTGDSLTYEIELPDGPENRVMVLCQAAKGMFPGLPLASNRVTFSSASGSGPLAVEWLIHPSSTTLRPTPPPVVSRSNVQHVGIPVMTVDAAGADWIWWQVSEHETFESVMSNFDSLQKPTAMIRLATPIETTFFFPHRMYYFRAKQRVGGVWSRWSDPVAFTVTRPDAPKNISVDQNRELTTLSWQPHDDEIWIYGSDRMDFLPEHFSTIEPTRIENNRIVESKKNQNLLVKTSGKSGRSQVPRRSFYRLVSHREGRLSIPSELIHAPVSDALPASILLNVHQRPSTDVATPVTLPVR